MLISKLDDILSKTSEQTKFSPEIVADVIKHLFSYLRNFLLNPSHVGLRVTFLGVFRPDKKALNFHLKRLIKYMREDNSEKNVDEFRKYWRLRRLLQEDTERRNFKKRYGKWHFK